MKLNKSSILSEEEINQIDLSSRKALSEIGLLIHSEEVLKKLDKKGIEVDYNEKTAKFNDNIIEACINSAPDKIKIFNREKNYFLNIGNGKTHTVSGHNAIYYYDEKLKKRRPISKKEVGNFALISDYLDNIDMVGIEAVPQDVNPRSAFLHALDAVFMNTKKPVYFSPENVNEVEALLEIVGIIDGSSDVSEKPIGVCQISPISPLSWSEGTSEALVMLAERNFPLLILPQPYAGVTAPLTMAGLITINNIENLGGLIISQIINPGSPVIYGAGWTTFEMKKSAVLIGTPERNICTVAGSQLADFYKMPSHCIAFDTDSNLYDEQNGFEKIFNVISTMQSGIDIVINAGMLGTGMSVSYEQLIVDNEIAKFVRKYINGLEVNKSTIGFETIKKVSHHNNFMMEEHTLDNLKSNDYMDYDVSNRDIYDNWADKGMLSITDNGKNCADQIIKEHSVKELSRQQKSDILEVIKKFESSL